MASDTKNVKLGVCQITLGGSDLGYTKGGVEVEVATSTHKVMVDQFGESEINEYVTGRTVKVRVPLAETTLENMVAIMPGATLVETGGANATGTIDFGVTNPSDGDTVTINGVVITFKTAGTGESEVTIGATLAATLTALAAALNAHTDARVQKADYTEDGAILTVTYYAKLVEGNVFTIAASVATASAATLAGGSDSQKRVDAQHGIGMDLLSIAQELRLHPVANAADNFKDDFWVPRAATAGQVSYAYKLDEERVFNVEFTGYPDSNTDLLFKVGDPNA